MHRRSRYTARIQIYRTTELQPPNKRTWSQIWRTTVSPSMHASHDSNILVVAVGAGVVAAAPPPPPPPPASAGAANSSRTNRCTRLDFPTPLAPVTNTLAKKLPLLAEDDAGRLCFVSADGILEPPRTGGHMQISGGAGKSNSRTAQPLTVSCGSFFALNFLVCFSSSPGSPATTCSLRTRTSP